MKLLVANHWLKKLGGSETFTYALIKALKEAGHEVDFLTTQTGLVSQRIIKDLHIKHRMDDSYDYVLASHKTMVEHCFKYKVGPIIQTCHGTIPKLEQPSDKASYHVAISSEVKQHLKKLGYKSSVILNGIDCKRFAPLTCPHKEIRKVLSLSHSEQLNTILRNTLAKYHIRLITINKYVNPVWDIEKLMQDSDMVVSLGRGAYEAMSCGCAVLVLDLRPYMQKVLGDGIITAQNINDLLINNCSGRRLMRTDINEMLTEAFDLYSPAMCEFNRHFAINNLNINQKVNQYDFVLRGLKAAV